MDLFNAHIILPNVSVKYRNMNIDNIIALMSRLHLAYDVSTAPCDERVVNFRFSAEMLQKIIIVQSLHGRRPGSLRFP